MFADTDRSNARTAPAMRDAESLVQVQVRYVRPELARIAHADHCVEIRAVQIDLTAMLMDDIANLADRFLEHAMRRWVGHHQGAKIFRMFRRLGL